MRLERENSMRVGRLEDSVRTLATTVSGMETSVSYIRSAVDQLAQRTNRGVNWGWVLTGLLGVTAVFGGYSALIQRPLVDRVQSHTEMLDTLQSREVERAFDSGYQRARQDYLLQQLENLSVGQGQPGPAQRSEPRSEG